MKPKTVVQDYKEETSAKKLKHQVTFETNVALQIHFHTSPTSPKEMLLPQLNICLSTITIFFGAPHLFKEMLPANAYPPFHN
jgi:hypothetical protein